MYTYLARKFNTAPIEYLYLHNKTIIKEDLQ